MASRQELYQKFGPLLVEAVVLVIKDEINILRTTAGLAPRTGQQIINAISEKLDGTPVYDWMEEQI